MEKVELRVNVWMFLIEALNLMVEEDDAQHPSVKYERPKAQERNRGFRYIMH